MGILAKYTCGRNVLQETLVKERQSKLPYRLSRGRISLTVGRVSNQLMCVNIAHRFPIFNRVWQPFKFNAAFVLRQNLYVNMVQAPLVSLVFRCLDCKKSFQLDYAYEARKPGVKEKIVEMAMNSSGVRETGRVLNVSYNTVLSTLKNSRQGR